MKNTRILLVITLLLLGSSVIFSQNVTIVMRPSQIDLSSATSESAVLVTIAGYPTSDVRYRLYSGTNQYNCWNGTEYVTSNAYANGPQVPGNATTSTTWWILSQRGTNNSTSASYRDRLGPDYTTNYQTQALPAAQAITSPFEISSIMPDAINYDLDVKYVVLGFDSVTGGTLITAASTGIDTGAYTLKVETGMTIRRIEFRSITNETLEVITGEWPPEDAVAAPTFNPPAGTYYGAINVTISTTTPGATIHYTTNGDDPTQASPVFTDPILVDAAMTIKARGYADDLDPSTISIAIYNINYPVEINDIATLRASPQDGTVYMLSNQAILSFKQTFRNQKFVQDTTGGILIDDDPGVIGTVYNVNDGIAGLTGTISTYANMLQFVPIQDPGQAASSGNQIVPVTITMTDFIDNIMQYQSRVVKLNNVHFPAADGTATFTNGQVYTLSDGVNTINFRTTFYDADYINTVIPVGNFSLRGIPNSRAEGHFITARNLADFLPSTGDIELLIQPESADFGDVLVGETSSTVNFVVTNNGNVNVTILEVSLVGQDPDDFDLTDPNQYPLVLTPDDEMTFSATFTPLTSGLSQALIEIEATDNTTTAYFELPITGNGVSLIPVANLAAEIINWNDVELSWSLSTARLTRVNRTLLGFDVYRNNILISPDTPLPPTTTSYVDMMVPAGDYEYYVEAIYSAGVAPSEIVDISIAGPVNMVSMTPEPGEYQEQVTIELTIPDGTGLEYIYYTLDGEDPTSGSLEYTSPFVINESKTVKAKAYYYGWEPSGITTGVYTIVVSADDDILPALTTNLHQNRPNPFNPETIISFTIKKSDRVEVTIYSIRGERVKTLIDEYLPSGEHAVVWSGVDEAGKQMPSGVYFYRLKTGDHKQIRKMVMIK